MARILHDVANSVVIHSGIARVPGFDGNYEAIELHSLAQQFYKAALTVNADTPAPCYTLLTHSIELALKCFLHLHGIGLAELAGRRFGHRLDNLLDAALRLGLPLSNAETRGIVDRLNKGAVGASIRYCMPFTMPLREDVVAVAAALLCDAAPPIPGVQTAPSADQDAGGSGP